ncbi:holin family protein [Salipiger sp. H15]|uniref:Holin family protein n=1 Tax=Alloyangia sp. H15 TaxID=3029062 RepID=A0AAU8AEG2_9RHOB
MGMITALVSALSGPGGTLVRDTAEVFRENAEAASARDASLREAALAQFAQEFARPAPSPFDRVIDGLNRLPRPAMAFGTLGLLTSAMVDPAWFAARMEGLSLVPEPLWWLLGAVVSFYFGARHQAKGQSFRREIVAGLAAASKPDSARAAPLEPDGNAALDEWRAQRDPGSATNS